MGQQETKVGGKRMIELEQRYSTEFKDIDNSGITDIMDLGLLVMLVTPGDCEVLSAVVFRNSRFSSARITTTVS